VSPNSDDSSKGGDGVLPDGGDTEVSREQVTELADLGETDPAAVADEVATLVAALDHEASDIREDAVRALNHVARYDPAAAAPAAAGLAERIDDGEIRWNVLDVLRTLARYEPGAVEPFAGEVFDAVGEGDGMSVSRTAVEILARLREATPGTVAPLVRGRAELLATPDVPEAERVAAAESLSLLAIDDIDLVEPVLPELLEHLDDDNGAVARSMVYVAGHAVEAGRHTEALGGHESALRDALEADEEQVRKLAARALVAAGADIDDAAVPAEDWSEESAGVPERSVFRLPADRLDRALSVMGDLGATVPAAPVSDDVELDMRFRLSADREFTPTDVLAHADLAEVCRTTGWVDLDANHGYEAGERFVYDRFRVGGPGTTPTATAAALSPGRDPDLLVYLPMENDWERDTWTPSVLMTPDGTLASFDAETPAAASAAVEMAIRKFVAGLVDEEPTDALPNGLVTSGARE
jgi:hypothetical protein